MSSIIKNLHFRNIDANKENIFSQNNFVYKIFEDKFNNNYKDFISLNNAK